MGCCASSANPYSVKVSPVWSKHADREALVVKNLVLSADTSGDGMLDLKEITVRRGGRGACQHPLPGSQHDRQYPAWARANRPGAVVGAPSDSAGGPITELCCAFFLLDALTARRGCACGGGAANRRAMVPDVAPPWPPPPSRRVGAPIHCASGAHSETPAVCTKKRRRWPVARPPPPPLVTRARGGRLCVFACWCWGLPRPSCPSPPSPTSSQSSRAATATRKRWPLCS
jgi:hypothetical protein